LVREIPGPAGRLEALLDDPDTSCQRGPRIDPPKKALPRAAVVLAHPHPLYGGTMHTKAVFQVAKGLCSTGCAVLRFNFRGTGTSDGAFDEGRGEMDDFRAALDFMASRYPGSELWAAGFSFGASIALSVGAGDDRASALIGIACPVGQYDLEVLASCTKPKFLIHGERDELFPLRSIRELYSRLPEPKELVIVDAADHVFDGKASELADTMHELLGDFQALEARE
jgi:uncharacterized protein